MTSAQGLIRGLQQASRDTPFTVAGTRRGLELVTEPVLDAVAGREDDHLQVLTRTFSVTLHPRTRTGTVLATAATHALHAGEPVPELGYRRGEHDLDERLAARAELLGRPQAWLEEQFAARGWTLREEERTGPSGGLIAALLGAAVALVTAALLLILL